MNQQSVSGNELRQCLGAWLICLTVLGLAGCGGGETETKPATRPARQAEDGRADANPPAGVNPVTATQRVRNLKYLAALPAGFKLPDDSDAVGQRILADYGAVYVARGGVTPPPVTLFRTAAECANWQAGLAVDQANIKGTTVELQKPALAALQAARVEAANAQLDITPRGEDAARRSYETTVTLWRSRVEPALAHWVGVGRLAASESERIRALAPAEQVAEVLQLEAQGLYFSKDFAKSILYSVAAPGTSQHLSLLALDVAENENPKVRALLAQAGWFQTVPSDTPHFTYLGVTEDQLPNLGLKPVNSGGRIFWVPALDG